MLISLTDLIRKYTMKVTGVIHVGAHFGEEVPEYTRNGINNIVLVEPCAAAFKKLYNHFAMHHHIQLFNCACGTIDGEAVMNIETANTGQSNSVLKPLKHLEHYPDIQFVGTEVVKMHKLDSFNLPPKYNMLNMDVQGAEGHVLLGGKKTLANIRYVYTEVNEDGAELYEGATPLSMLDELLREFERVETYLTGQGWGDALYIRK